MATRNKTIIPARAIHPGEVLREELQERGIKQKDFAAMIGVQATHLNAFIRGKRNMSAELALKLESSLGISCETWMSLHTSYLRTCEAIAKRQSEESEAAKYECALADRFNLKCLYSNLSISDLTTSARRVEKLKELFPFDLLTSDIIEVKHLNVNADNEKDIHTWLALNWLTASKLSADVRFEKGNADLAAREIAQMANNRTMSTDSIKSCLGRYGITFTVQPTVGKAPVDACSTMANAHPCLTVTCRCNDLDKLAFDILRQLCHIGHHMTERTQTFISIEQGDTPTNPLDKEADAFASEMLIPGEIWMRIMGVGCNSLSPSKIVKTIATESAKFSISPSIAVSRYRKETGWYRPSTYKSPKIHG